jgi:hypothetical protein
MPQKLDIGSVFEQVFQLYRKYFGLLIAIAILVLVIPIVLANLIAGSGASIFGTLFIVFVGIAAGAYFQSVIIDLAREETDAKQFTLGSLFRAAVPVLLPVIGASILVGIAVAVGFILLIVPGFILLTFLAVVIPTIVVEKTPISSAFGRSYELVKGNAWQVFGVIAVLYLLTFVAGIVLGAIALAVSNTFAAQIFGSVIGQCLISPLFALAGAVLFFKLLALQNATAGAEVNHDEPSPFGSR